jgi:hypothetical protein
MAVTTFEAVVENGHIRLPVNVRLPEKSKVYVISPGVELKPAASIASPRLVHPEQVKDFQMEVVEENWNETPV